ncbi:uncharacterized protein LOC111271469 [Varroa jacobsoni]|uniref:uncharacterized protein LOC111271469 n=1 Tax=Varroa jacobsoni TaxID=62625 RepID=UPI000BF51EF8|nr:uncharacterized protein LOC111271469 [Varroa jacobsoni]
METMKVLVVFSTLAIGVYAQRVTFNECGSNEYFTLKQVDLKDKITFPSIVRGDVHAVVNKDIPADATISFQVYKIINIFGERRIKIPCVGIYGSCDYNLCKFIAKKTDPIEPRFDICVLWPEGMQCGCPVSEGMVFKKQNAKLLFPQLSTIVKLLNKGKYVLNIQLRDAQRQSLYCVDFNVHIG